MLTRVATPLLLLQLLLLLSSGARGDNYDIQDPIETVHYVEEVVDAQEIGAAYTQLGCFVDKNRRDLPHWVKSSGSMTVSKCGELCSAKGYAYFGVQYSTQCFCGNSYGRYGKRPNGECNKKCNGNRHEYCGGTWRNSVYATGITAKVAYTQLGCFIDKHRRDLPKWLKNSGSMTVSKCGKLCSAKGYAYFGVQYSTQCFCGNSYGRYGKRPINECNKKCNGNRHEYCGGTWRNSVYATGVKAKAAYTRLGCYVDKSRRDVSRFLKSSGSMTVKNCGNMCRARGYAYFGVQYSSQCFCGNSYGRYGKRPINECNKRCSGNSHQYCGGTWRNSVYATGIKAKAAYTQLGCYVDKSRRDLSKFLKSSGSMTVKNCGNMCRAKGYKYFGVQYSSQCFCGNSYGRYGKRPISECRKKCSGNSHQYCGGTWRNQVYKILR